jgi:hypothetical protein
MGRPRKDFVAAFDFISKEATSIEAAKSHRDCVYFDYFNPNGAYAVFQRLTIDSVKRLMKVFFAPVL